MFDYFRDLRKSDEEKQQEALNAYLDDTLSPQQRGQFEKTLATDADLKTQLEQMRLLKQQMRQLPRRQVPRNFTLDPALFGRPAREPLIQAYPVLRTATVLTAFVFIFLLAANAYLGGFSSQSIESSAPLAMMVEEADMATAEESFEFTSEPEVQTEIAEGEAAQEEAVAEETAGDEAALEAAAPLAPGSESDEIVGGEMEMPAAAAEAPAADEPAQEIAPQATAEPEEALREMVPAEETGVPGGLPVPAPTMAAEAAEITQAIPATEALPTVEQETFQGFKSTTSAQDRNWLDTLLAFPVLLVLVGIVLIILFLLTLAARRRL